MEPYVVTATQVISLSAACRRIYFIFYFFFKPLNDAYEINNRFSERIDVFASDDYWLLGINFGVGYPVWQNFNENRT